MLIKPHFDLYATHISDEIGYGVFTNEFIPKDSVVETSYCIPINPTAEWDLYKFKSKNNTNAFIPLGYAAIYNHSDNPNIRWHVISNHIIQFIALENIDEKTQLCHSYGSGYFKYHGIIPKLF